MSHLNDRVFSFHDVIALMDMAGVGVGSTIHIIREMDAEIARPNRTFRKFDYPAGIADDLCVCEQCGHRQGEPGWCKQCGHRTMWHEWAKQLRDRADRFDEVQRYIAVLIEALERNRVVISTDHGLVIEIESLTLDDFLRDAHGRQATMVWDEEDFEAVRTAIKKESNERRNETRSEAQRS